MLNLSFLICQMGGNYHLLTRLSVKGRPLHRAWPAASQQLARSQSAVRTSFRQLDFKALEEDGLFVPCKSGSLTP